ADGTEVIVEGVLTTALGATDSGHGAFVQDDTGGIALYLSDPLVTPRTPGERVPVPGGLDERFAMGVPRGDGSDGVAVGASTLPDPMEVGTSSAGEEFEAERVRVEGAVMGSPSTLADGIAFSIDDGSGPLRIIVGDLPDGFAVGATVRAVGPLGQRDSSGS